MSLHTAQHNPRRDFLTGKWRTQSSINASCLNYAAVFCQTCKEVCNEGAIVFQHAALGLQLPLILNERCNACMDCVQSCPSAAIRIKNTATSNARHE